MAYPNALALSDARSTRLHPARRQPLPTVATPAEDADLPSGHLTGFTLGWDHGHYGLTPPVELMFPGSSIRLGWEAARKAFGMRVLHPRAQTRRWLALRIDAWLRGISFELTQVTPHYLQQLETSWCPVLRRALDRDAEPSEPSSVARVRCDAGFAAGNLVVMSQQAQSAKAELSWQEAQERASSVEVGPIQTIAGLDAREWQRMAVLCSFVTPMPQSLAANIPMLLLPPNRLRLLNPIQALQALLTRQLASPGWHERLAGLRGAMPSQAQSAFDRFAMALLPRVHGSHQLNAPSAQRWALEDAWRDVRVQKRWLELALQLSEALTEQLVQMAAGLKLGTLHVQHHAVDLATEGWGLPTTSEIQPGNPWEKRSSVPN